MLAWVEAAIVTVYGLVLAGAGFLVQSGVIAMAAGAAHRVLAWHAYLQDPWFPLDDHRNRKPLTGRSVC